MQSPWEFGSYFSSTSFWYQMSINNFKILDEKTYLLWSINIGENHIAFFWYALINNNSNHNTSDNVKYDINIPYLCDAVHFNQGRKKFIEDLAKQKLRGFIKNKNPVYFYSTVLSLKRIPKKVKHRKRIPAYSQDHPLGHCWCFVWINSYRSTK